MAMIIVLEIFCRVTGYIFDRLVSSSVMRESMISGKRDAVSWAAREVFSLYSFLFRFERFNNLPSLIRATIFYILFAFFASRLGGL